MLAEKSRVHVVRDRPLEGSISSYFSSSLKKLNHCSLSTHDSDMMLYPELFIRSCTWLSPKAQHTGIWYIARSFPRFSAPFKTPGNHNVDAKQCQKQLSPRASPISPATMHGQKNALKQIPTFSKQPQRPLDQSLILKFSDHCSKVSFSSPNVMVLCFEATSGYRVNIVYNLCCPATAQTIFLIGWPNEPDDMLIKHNDDDLWQNFVVLIFKTVCDQ